jgi:hypothetical protein
LDYIIEIKAMILRQFAVFVPSFCGSFVLAPDQVSYFISLSALRRRVFFFCRRAVWSGGFFHFTFAGWLREFNKKTKRSHHMANRNTNPSIGGETKRPMTVFPSVTQVQPTEGR